MKASSSQVIAILLCLLFVENARAEPSNQALFEEEVSFGRPKRTIQLTVRTRPDGLEVSVDKKLFHAGITQAQKATARSWHPTNSPQNALLIVEVQAEAKHFALIFGEPTKGPKLLWTGDLIGIGDPGERVADYFIANTATLQIGSSIETVRTCNKNKALINAKQIDPRTHRIKSAPSRSVPTPSETYQPTLKGEDLSSPKDSPLRFVSVSSRENTPLSELTVSPWDLNNPKTLWIEGAPGSGTGEFIGASWEWKQLGLRALSFSVPQKLPRGVSKPQAIVVVTSSGKAIQLDWPAGNSQPYYQFTPSIKTDCLAFYIIAQEKTSTKTAIASIQGYSELSSHNKPSVAEKLMTRLDTSDGYTGEDMEILQYLRKDAIKPIKDHWEHLSLQGKKRSLNILQRIVQATPELSETVSKTLIEFVDHATSVSALALASTLNASKPFSIPALTALAERPDKSGDRAAYSLSNEKAWNLTQATRSLLNKGFLNRPERRKSLRLLLINAPEEELQKFLEHLHASSNTNLITITALEAARSLPKAAFTQQLIRATLKRRLSFQNRYRALQGLALSPVPSARPWISTVATSATEWMLRNEAVKTLAQYGPIQSFEWKKFLTDPYPRVRHLAIDLLSKQSAHKHYAYLYNLASKDPWWFNRQVSLRHLPSTAKALVVTWNRLRKDSVTEVRVQALRTLRRIGHKKFWPKITPLLRSNSADLRIEAMYTAAEWCRHEAKSSIQKQLELSIQPKRWHTNQPVAYAAIESLLRLGVDPAPLIPHKIRSLHHFLKRTEVTRICPSHL